MSFKFLRGDDNLRFTLTDYTPIFRINNNTEHQNNEYCFQFDDDEPFVFGTGNENLSITISPTPGGNIQFTHNGRSFKIFAREHGN